MKRAVRQLYRYYQEAGYPLLPLTRLVREPLRWCYHRSPLLRHDSRPYLKPYVLGLLHRALVRTHPADYSIYGDRLRFRSQGSEMSMHGYYVGEIEYHLVRFLAGRVRDGFVMFDVGAHHGLFTLVCAYELKRRGYRGVVYSFEPMQENYELLAFNVRSNGLEAYTRLYQVAVAARPGEGRLALGEAENSDNALLTGAPAAVEGARQLERVAVMALDQLIAGCERVDLIKIDVQGGEPAVLAGARRLIARDRPLLIVEAVPEWASTAQIRSFLRDHGYELFGVTRDGELCAPNSERAFVSWDWVGVPG